VIWNVSLNDMPPPGGGLTTVTVTGPVVVISLLSMVTGMSMPPPLVGLGTQKDCLLWRIDPKYSTESEIPPAYMKFLPVTAMVNGPQRHNCPPRPL
jgi:hypothetical protein